MYDYQRKTGPREEKAGGPRFKRAKYDWQKSVPGHDSAEAFPDRIPKVPLIGLQDHQRKTGPREETYPENWTPPPKEWESQLWRPDNWVDFARSSTSALTTSKRRKAPIRRAKTVSH